MTAKFDQPDGERRGKERVADNADWETKTLARVRARLKQAPRDASAPSATASENNWEQEVLKAMRGKLDKQ